MDAQTLTASQEGESAFGHASASITVFEGELGLGEATADSLREQFEDQQLGYSLAINSMDFPFYRSNLQGIYFSEYSWASDPPNSRFRLTSGTWPKAPGEVTIAGNKLRGVALNDKISVPGSKDSLKVVGIAQVRLTDSPMMLAAPGTWSSLRATEPESDSRYTAFPSFETRSSNAGAFVERTTNTLSAVKVDGVAEPQGTELQDRLKKSVRKRSAAEAEVARPWTSQSPLSLWVPGLILVPTCLLLGYLILLNKLIPSARRMIANGVRPRDAVVAVWLTPIPTVVIMAAALSALGGVVGFALASFGAGRWGYFAYTFRFPSASLSLVLVGLAVSLVAALFLVGMRASDLSDQRIQIPTSIRTAIPKARRGAAIALGTYAIWKLFTIREASDSMMLIGVSAFSLALLSPEIVAVIARKMPQKSLTQRLVARQVSFNHSRMALGVGTYIVLVAVTVGMLTVLFSQIEMLRQRQPDSVPVGHLLSDSNATAFLKPDPALTAALETVPALRNQTPVQFYMIGDRFVDPELGIVDAKNTIGTPDLPGLSFAFETVEDVQAVFGRPLSKSERSVLSGGGALVPEPDRVEVHDGKLDLVNNSTGKAIGNIRALHAEPKPSRWNDAVPIVTLRSTANERGWNTEPAASLYINISNQDAKDARKALIKAGLNPKLIGTYQPPPPIVPPAALAGSAIALSLLVLGVSLLSTRAQVRSMRSWASRLTDLGVSVRWARRCISVQYLWIGAVALPLGMVVALGTLALTRVRLPDLDLDAPWTLIMFVLLLMLGSTIAGSTMATRGLGERPH